MAAVLFTLMTGPVAWMMRRAPRKTFLITLGAIVTGFCLIAIILGLTLRQVDGEVWWSSLTELAPDGGGLQTVVLELESAGAQNHHLALTGPTGAPIRQPDALGAWFRTNTSPIGSAGEPIQVPLMPWAQTHRIAEDYAPDLKRISCQIQLDPNLLTTLTWENPNAFRILGAQLFLMHRLIILSGDAEVIGEIPRLRFKLNSTQSFSLWPSRGADVVDAATGAEGTPSPSTPPSTPLSLGCDPAPPSRLGRLRNRSIALHRSRCGYHRFRPVRGFSLPSPAFERGGLTSLRNPLTGST